MRTENRYRDGSRMRFTATRQTHLQRCGDTQPLTHRVWILRDRLPPAGSLCRRMTSSPGRSPSAASERCIAVVQEVTAIECLAPVNADHLSSNSRTFGPCTSQPLRKGESTDCISASVKLVRAIGTFIWGVAFIRANLRLSGVLQSLPCDGYATR